MRIYIAGAITGNPNYKEQFEAAEKMLKEKCCAYEIVNPIRNQGNSYKEYIDKGLGGLMSCDVLYLLEGWAESKGARLEYLYAKTVGMGICGAVQPADIKFM